MSELRQSSAPNEPKKRAMRNAGRTVNFRPKRELKEPFRFSRMLLMLILITAVSLFFLACHIREADLSFTSNAFEIEFDEYENRRERLIMDINRSSSLNNLEKRAAMLGFKIPTSDQYVRIAPRP